MFRLTSASVVLMFVLPAARAVAQEPAPTQLPPPAYHPQPAASPSPAGPVLELSLDEAVKRTLENNADIRVEKFNPDISEEAVKQQRGYYDPLLSSAVSGASRTNRASNVFAGGSTVDTGNVVYNLSDAEPTRTGGNFRVAFNNTATR